MTTQQQELQLLWQGVGKAIDETPNTEDFKMHQLPLARIKKIMKTDEDVRMISAEAPVIFGKACEMMIIELTMRAWQHTEENKRRTLQVRAVTPNRYARPSPASHLRRAESVGACAQRSDIRAVISEIEILDFLQDVVPAKDGKDGKSPGVGAGRAPGNVSMPTASGVAHQQVSRAALMPRSKRSSAPS